MRKIFAKIILKILGWKVQCAIDFNKTKQAVIAEAPHTSNWDFFYALLMMWSVGEKINFLIKDSFFVFPLSYIFEWLGGIPVDRSKRNSLVSQIVAKYGEGKLRYLGVSAEGTRSYTEDWKSGFYRIAEQANIPLYLGYIDYKDKVISIEHIFEISGNFEADLEKIKKFYKHITPKIPANYNLYN